MLRRLIENRRGTTNEQIPLETPGRQKSIMFVKASTTQPAASTEPEIIKFF